MLFGNHIPGHRRCRAPEARTFAGAPLLAVAALLLPLSPALAQQPAAVAATEHTATIRARSAMVERQLRARDIDNPRVLEVMGRVRRHLFVPERMQGSAYRDSALPIDDGQTISQPYIVALMTQQLALEQDDRVLEVGTGSGYQAAVLAELAGEVFTIEIRPLLHEQSKQRLAALGYANVRAFEGDGYFGIEQHAPFDHIMITAAIDHIPAPLLEQLAPGGTMILPLGNPFSYQNLVLVTKTGSGSSGADYTVDLILGVLFVPMTGHALQN
ncbi:MAG: protein-L-isoaspartate(D-aspartate) O-methyltransferase [Spirochaetaceae bacterium]|nr:protein-L-isoaspartate(D-aspartate) O-methyltransferase [Spirochaetaceae bacterium]